MTHSDKSNLSMKKKVNKNILATLLSLLLNIMVIGCSFGQSIPMDTALRIGKLQNGLTYYLRYNNTPKGQADFYIIYKVGSVLEEENQRGLAHFLEHMAFNGTQHFPGNSLITELEKKGVKFGRNINAITSYDETIYKLTNIPVIREGILDTALLILYDWSGFILNRAEDIDEERGVVLEEWRSRSSGYTRTQENILLPTLFIGTPYANRLPIGTLDVINNFKYQELRDYYRRWYRPDLQGIVIVGDIDVDKTEAKLKRIFATIPAPINPVIRKYYQIPNNKQPIIAIASDPEIRNASARIYWKQDTVGGNQKKSLQFFKIGLVNNIVNNMLNERFTEMAKKSKNTYFPSAAMGTYSISSRPSWIVNVNAPNNDLKAALKLSLVECERMRRFGFNKNEFEPTIRNFNLVNIESNYFDRNNKENSIYSVEYVEQFLNGGISPTPEWKYRTCRDILNGLTIDTLNFYAKKYVSNCNMAIEIVCPTNRGVSIPEKEDILRLLEEVKSMNLKPWVKKEKPSDLANLKSPKPGRVIKAEKNVKPLGFTKWKFSNGVTVWYKKTNYDESDILVYGYKLGGYSLVGMNDLPSAMAYNRVSSVGSGFEGIDGRSNITSTLDKNYEAISGRGSILHLNVFFKHIYLRMTRFKKEQEIFDNWKNGQEELYKSKSSDPKIVYSDSLASIMNNHHPRAFLIDDIEALRKVSYHRIIKLHKERFGNANEFTFIITGNVAEDRIKDLSEKWLGSLPSLKKWENIVDHEMYPPTITVKKHFNKKMETPQSSITIGYTGEISYDLRNSLLMTFASEIFKLVYLEVIREKEGGSYGVSVDGELIKYPTERFIFQINFDTNPDVVKKEKLIEIIYQEINKMMKIGPEQDKVNKVKHSLLNDYNEGLSKQNARYWNSMAVGLLFYGVDWHTNYNKIILSITPEMIKDFTKLIFSQGHLIEVVMDPE